MKPATPKARALLAKLEALAARGINGEKDEAKRKVAKLRARFDFSAPVMRTADLFAGVFQRSTIAAHVAEFTEDERDIANAAKWAIETATRIPCLFRNGELYAEATPDTAARLESITKAVREGFTTLWRQWSATPGSNPTDRGSFILGLYEGMMNEERHGEALPPRLRVRRIGKAKKRAVASVAGLQLHPYTVAAGLGRQIRNCVPFDDVAERLENIVKGEITA